jgi:DNA-binding SARP family transcriptional activator/lipopolysaccharide biosynthesis regulator YciM
MINISLLGNPVISQNGKPLRLRDRKGMALIAYLTLEGQTSRDKLADLLWGDRDLSDARRNLRQRLYELKPKLPEDFLETNGEHVQIAGTFTCDLETFREHLASGNDQAALEAYRGPFLDGLEPEGSDAFMTWLEATRDELIATHHEILRRTANAREATGDLRGALQAHQQLLQDDELQEFHQRETMRLHEQLGEREAALRQYERYRQTLEQELGDVPLPETQALAERLRSKNDPRAITLETDARVHLNLQPPLIGREPEWQTLRDHPNHLALIIGEPGIGKTRLASEFANAHTPTRTLRGREGSSGSPLYPVAETLRQALNEPDWLQDLEPVWRSECARLIPEIDPDNPAPAPPASLEGRVRFLEGLARALETIVGGTGTLVLDDLHWFDAASLELVAHLVRRSQSANVRLIATARSQELGENTNATPILTDLKRDGMLQQINLEPLQERDVRGLVQSLTSGHDAPRFAHRLHSATTGNPFFLLETLRDLYSAGTLRVMANGTWTTPFDSETETYAELPIPATVRETVLSRADRAGAATRRLLEAASLAGDGFDLNLISSATALSEWEGVDALERAVQAELLHPLEHGYRFNHDLTRRSLEDALNPDRRKLIHRKLAVSLETAGGLPDRIAEHYEQGGMNRQAAPWRVKAGEAAARVYAYEQALEQYQKALEDGMEDEEEIEVSLPKITILRTLDRSQEALAYADQILARHKDSSGSDLIIEIQVERAEIIVLHGNATLSLSIVEKILKLTDLPLSIFARATYAKGMSLQYSGEKEKALLDFLNVIDLNGSKNSLITARAHISASDIYRELGEIQKAEHHCNLAEKIYKDTDDVVGASRIFHLKGLIFETKKEYINAEEAYEKLKTIGIELNSNHMYITSQIALSKMALMKSEGGRSLYFLDNIDGEKINTLQNKINFYQCLSYTYILLGKFQTAYDILIKSSSIIDQITNLNSLIINKIIKIICLLYLQKDLNAIPDLIKEIKVGFSKGVAEEYRPYFENACASYEKMMSSKQNHALKGG